MNTSRSWRGSALGWIAFWIGVSSLNATGMSAERSKAKARVAEESETFSESEPFKGPSDSTQFMAGGSVGLGIISGFPAFDILGFVALKIVPRGFVPDINDSVWIELQTGPAVTQGVLAIPYSAHMRWDFVRDQQWTLFATGGLAGTFVGVGAASTRVEFFPRAGIGAFLHLTPGLLLRADLSHEFTALGVAFQI